MAGQSITFDFLTTGADRTASGFRKVGDNTVLAARGAKVLADAIEKLGQKEDRTAAESKILASALRQTGEAEDRVAAKAVVADAAIRRLDDAMEDSSKHSGELSKTLSGLKLNPGLVGPLLALAPAIATLGGVGAGAAAGLGGAFIAGGLALSAFGAVAKPILTDAKKAAGAVEKAQNAYNVAIANGVPQVRAFKAEQLAIAKAYAGMSPAQIALSKQLGDMASAWDKVKTAETPVVAGALQPWLKSVTGLTASLAPVIAKIAPVIASLGGQFGSLVGSSAFKGFRDFIGSTGSAAVSAGGSTIIDLVKSFMILLPKFDPLIREAVGWISRLGPAVLTWASSKKASDDITRFMQWFSQNGPVVGGLLKNIGGALKAMAPGLTAGGTAELQVMSQFFALIARLPPGVAKPLFEVAGAMLILQKTGVVSVGIKLVGLGAGAAGAGAAAGPLAAAGAAIAGGIILEIRRDLAKGWHTAVADLPKLLEGVGGILSFSASGWANTILDHFAKPIRQMWDSLGHFLAASFDVTRHQVARAWAVMTGDIVTVFDIAKEGIRVVWDKIEILFLRGEDFIVRTMGKLPGPLGAPFRAAHASIQQSLAQIQGDVRTATGNIQADWDRLHGKTVRVNFVGSGSGSIAFKESIPGVTTGPSSGGLLGFHAAGGFISGGTPGRDSVAAMLMPGEVVVPVSMVRAGAVDHLRGRLPGFASGGSVTGMGAPGRIDAAGEPYMAGTEAAFGRAVEGAFASKVIAKFRNDMKKAAAGSIGNYKPGAGVQQWRGVTGRALALAGSSQGLTDAVLYQMQTESGGNPRAVNRTDSNWIAGHPSVGLMQVIRGTFAAYAGQFRNTGPFEYGVSENPLANIYSAIRYAQAAYGPNLRNVRGGIGSGHGYAEGGLVPGYASCGTVGKQGSAWLKAWQSRHGGGFGAAHGPAVLNQQIAAMTAALGRARALAGARGLTGGQHRFWAAAAADEAKRLAVLHRELTVERAWRGQLGLGELALDKEIRAAWNLPALRGPVRGWKAALGRDRATVTAISAMLGYSDAHQAAVAKAHPKAKPPAQTGVLATHSYGGDVADTIGAFLSSVAAPFGAARGGLVMDSGGWLKPGWNPPMLNNTGRPEHLVPARGGGGGTVRLEIRTGGSSADEFLATMIKKYVKVRGGGDVQRAYGSRLAE